LSSHALQFWVQNAGHFDVRGKGLYESGYSGWALKLARWLFKFMGISEDVKKLCSATTISEQVEIYETKVYLFLVDVKIRFALYFYILGL
jgi:betaine lipid synthase